MGRPLRVLMVEDSEADALLVIRKLNQAGYDPIVKRVDTHAAMAKVLLDQAWDIVLCDYDLPKFSAPDALALVKKSGLDLPFIIVSGKIAEDMAVAAMKSGAQDYILKNDLSRLGLVIERELREVRVRREREQAARTIKYLAYYDPLTAFPNRILLLEHLQRAIVDGRQAKHAVALILMDLDRFKEINDTLGHDHGDNLLYQVGSRLKRVLFEPDIVSRLGGDEFAVMLPRLAAAEHITVVVQKILKALEDPFMIEKLPIAVETSIGIALYPDHGADAETLFQRADVAMYEAKRTGSGYTLYAAELDQHSPRRLALMGALRKGIERNQLFLHYQPKVSLTTGRVIGLEGLVRWRHPEYGLIPPEQFIGPAEQTGLIGPLTQWVITTALNDDRAWRDAQIPLTVSVNLSTRSLHDSRLPVQLAEWLRLHGGSPERLELEITESAIMADPGQALEILFKVYEMGVRFSIDDFGTGYSSLAYLRKLPVDAIKIDKSFVINMASDPNDLVIVRSTIELGHNMGIKVVAEGVENKETYQRLIELGCDAAQGYYMSRPLPLAELNRWLDESPWGSKQA
ncbi:MAG TPA: EAL domain-containing protein [Nitrospiria bacterium]|nr:EAL domain-containing protein [Nitrospiria bacterium]